MPAARAASARETPSSTSARASIRRAARASRHRPASRRSSAAPGSRRVTATVMAPSADRLHRRSTPAGRAWRHGPNGHKPRPLVSVPGRAAPRRQEGRMHDSLYWLIGLAAVAVLLILVFRRGGVRLGAKGFGTEVSLEGKGAPDKAPEPAP